MTNRKDITYSLANFDNNDFSVESTYEKNKPVIKGYDEVYSIINAINNRYSNYIIQTADEAKEINKRGGLLTQLRKINGQIDEYKRGVHRQAKDSYSEFDDKMSALSSLVNNSIDKLKQQIDDFKEQEHIKNLNDTEDLFNELLESKQFKDKLPKWCTFKFMINFQPKLVDEGPKKRKKLIIDFLVKVYNDSNKIKKEYLKYKTTQFIRVAVTNYRMTLDVDDAIVKAIDAHNEAIKLAHEIAQKEIEEAKKEKEKAQEIIKNVGNNEVPSDLKTKKDSGSIKNDEKVYYAFMIDGVQGAKMTKKFLDENNIKYAIKKIVK